MGLRSLIQRFQAYVGGTAVTTVAAPMPTTGARHVKIQLTAKMGRKMKAAFAQLTERMINMSAELDKMEAQVEKTRGVMASAVVLINGVKGQLDAAIAELAKQGIDNAKLSALSEALDKGDDELESLLTANAPAGDTGAAGGTSGATGGATGDTGASTGGATGDAGTSAPGDDGTGGTGTATP